MLCVNVYQRFLKLVEFVIFCFFTLVILRYLRVVGRVTEFGEGAVLTAQGIDTIKVIYLFYLYSYPFDSQEATEALIHRLRNYPDLLPEMPRYCCLLVI